MELTFFGTGAAFAGDAHNAAYLLDRRLLIDCGAPVHVLMNRTGHDLCAVEAAIITHQHADHTFGLPFFLASKAIDCPGDHPFVVAGPPGFEAYFTELMLLAWGSKLKNIVWERLRLRFVEVAPGSDAEVAGFHVHAERMIHVPEFPCLGYVFEKGGVKFGFSGDCGVCPGLDALVELSDQVLVEMTGVSGDPGHMSRSDVEALVAANPGKRFYLTHLNRRNDPEPVPGAVMAEDSTTVELAPRG